LAHLKRLVCWNRGLSVESDQGVLAELHAGCARLGNSEALDRLVDMFRTADIDFAPSILNVWEDLLTRSCPASISEQRHRAALVDLGIRLPLFRRHIDRLLNTMDELAHKAGT
jgi:hypothetical protein